ncbi:porin [Undibacterium sp.]|uniref:porin n=1 Tax=Undibacterium sp. TaxID=1914977 RepID=UPI002BFECCEE|nr:porin [Undibacterium sp.]HTD07129.1 porin [Undibacterium sp.]
MKKSLLALSVLAAFAGVAHAQSSITIYGVVDMAIQNENRGGNSPGSVTALDSGEQSGSRLGFKGTEDLGGGLKAIFDLEMGVNADTGTSSQGGLPFGRQAWVGLAGDFGSVTMGRQYTPIFIATDTIDPWDAGFNSTGGGPQAGVGTSTAGTLGLFGTPFRTNNTVNYSTNNLGGFTGSVAYTFGEVAGDSSASRQIGLSGTYAGGPVTGTLAYHKVNDVAGNATKLVFLGGIYDFTVAKLHAAYGKTTSDLNTVDTKEWMVGTTVPFGAAALIATYTRVTNNLVAAGKGQQYAIGGTYALSKRTNFYGNFARTSNDANSNAGGIAFSNGATDRLVNFGIRHKF